MRLGLTSIKDLLSAIGEPHLAAPVVHVAGTNGKGSVCTMVTQVLMESGYRVGTLTSPHLEQVNERIRIDGRPIDDSTLGEAIGALDRKRWDWARQRGIEGVPLTYFEFVTALAFQVFAQRAVNVMVVEVGLGGRLDATNVVQPVVTAVTSIGMDHTDRLGDTLAAIAAEKAGIFKPGVPAVVGPMAAEALEVMRATAARRGCPLWEPGRHLQREGRSKGWMFRSPGGEVGPVKLAMEGQHQGANASVAVGILHMLQSQGFALAEGAIETGLAKARIPGRLETLRAGLIVDGAHNPDGAAALASWLRSRPRPASRILLFGCGRDRDPNEVLRPLLPFVDEVVLTQCAHPKARSPHDIAERLGEVDVVLSDGGPIEECLAEIFVDAEETIVSGSLYLVGAARELVAQGELEGLVAGSGAE